MHSIQFRIQQKPERFKTASDSKADVLVIMNEESDFVSYIHPQLAQAVETYTKHETSDDQAEKEQFIILPTLGLITYSYVVIASNIKPGTHIEHIRKAGARLAKLANTKQWSDIEILFNNPNAAAFNQLIYALTEGILLGHYKRTAYRLNQKKQPLLSSVTYTVASEPSDTSALEQCIKIAQVYASATNYARDLTNIPGNRLTPAKLAEEARALAENSALEVELLDEKQLIERGMMALYSVGKGSQHPPRMIAIKYQGRNNWDQVLGLVGKGITFDTGGISLKRADGMDEMISDMGGAAAVLGAMKAIAELKPNINVCAVIPAAENMPSSSAYKPGDVIDSLSGKTIEVLNTDAEGRIVLADGITYAKQLGANKLIDVATLTGAVMVALGDQATGAVSNDDQFLKSLMPASEMTGERIWQFPVYPEYKKKLESDVADIKNHGGRYAGTITGGLFIGAFAEETPWIHLDIGGTAFLDREQALHPKGATGVMVRTLIEFATGQIANLNN